MTSADLLYQITKSLDIVSQRNLFLSSSSLYSKWHISVPDHEQHWHFVQRGLELLEATTYQGTCCIPSTSIQLHSQFLYTIRSMTCKQQHQNVQFSLHHGRGLPGLPGYRVDYANLSKDHLWHRLTAISRPASASLSISASDTTPVQLKHFAKQCFEFLCTTSGCLRFVSLTQTLAGHKGRNHFEVSHKVCDNGCSHWQIDRDTCITNPPELRFDKMPTAVQFVTTEFVSKGVPGPGSLQLFGTTSCAVDCQLAADFAYNGNIC